MPRIPATRLVRAINIRHGTTFIPRRRYTSGEQGAYALGDGAGGRYVLKWSADSAHEQRIARAVAITFRLRARGYPAPEHLYWGEALGGIYSIQRALPGSPLRVVTPAQVPRLLALSALQVGAATAPATDWPRHVVDSVLHGCEGYCELESLRTYSAATAELLRALQRIASAHAHTECATGDIVHMDCNPANILVRRGVITGVIDWEGARAGDAAFDLATLLFYCYASAPVREVLWRAVRARATSGALALYLAHMCLRQVDWSIRYHDASTVERYLHIAQDIVGACQAAAL